MNSATVEEQIKKATDSVVTKNKELNSDVLKTFVEGCDKISTSYSTLADTYTKESDQWAELVSDLLKCAKQTIPANGNFDDLLKNIEDMSIAIEKSFNEISLTILNWVWIWL